MTMPYSNADYEDSEAEKHELMLEDKHRRKIANHMMRHPDPRDPDYIEPTNENEYRTRDVGRKTKPWAKKP